MNYEKNFILRELQTKLSLKDKIILHLLRNYTYIIYIKGIKKGFDWNC